MKLLFVGRRAAGRTRSAAQRHLALTHGRMVVLPPADAGAMPSGYTQHHVLDGAYPEAGGAHGLERDLVTEFHFDDMDHLRRSTQTDYYLRNLAPDEPRFVDGATVEKLRVTPRSLRDGERGQFKLLLLLTRRAGADWDVALDRTAATLQEAGFGAVEMNDATTSPMGAPFVDAVLEAWHREAEPALTFADQFAALPIAAEADLDRSLALATEVFTTARLQALAAD